MGSRATTAEHHPSERLLSQNLARLSGRSAELGREIRAAKQDSAEVVLGPRGHATVSWQGQLMASAYDPVAEGQKMAGEIGAEVDLVIALGFGTGHHLQALLERGNLRVLALEPELGLLRCALSANELPLLRSEHLVLTSDADELVERFAEAYAVGMHLQVLTHPGFGRCQAELSKDLIPRIARTKELIDCNVATLRSHWEPWAKACFENAEDLLKLPKIQHLKGVWSGSAVICAAGPSLSKQLGLLSDHASELLIVAIGQSAGALEEAGITPDLIYVVENQDVSHQLEKMSSLGEQTLVLAPHAHPALYALSARHRIVAPDGSDEIGGWLSELTGPPGRVATDGSVALSAVWLAEYLGAQEIALIGQDLAFTDGHRYASGSAYADLKVEQQEDGQIFFTNLKTKGDLFDRYTPDRELAPNTLWVEGWDGEPVLTDRSYAGFRETYRKVGRTLAERKISLINCTEGGARIPELEHRAFADWISEQRGKDATARTKIERRIESAPPIDLDKARADLSRVEREMARVQKTSRAGVEQSTKLLRATARNRGFPENLLRQTQKSDADLRKSLDRLPQLVFLMQDELQRLQADSRRATHSDDATLARRSRDLFRAAAEAIRQLRPFLKEVHERLEALAARSNPKA